MDKINRRNFMVAGAAFTGGMLLAPSVFAGEVVEIPQKWDKEVDIIAIGTGLAGSMAAIVAKDAGADVILLEKQPYYGGNSIIAGGIWNAVDPKRQKAQGIEDSIEKHTQQTLAGGDFRAQPEKVKYLAEHSLEAYHWMEEIGVPFEEDVFTGLGSLWPRTHSPIPKSGGTYFKFLKPEVEKRKIPILMEHKVTGIIREEPLSGDVLGVRVQTGKKNLFFKARKGVLLASGGFGADVKLRTLHDPRLTANIPTTNHPGATGEVLVYAQNIGAATMGMDYIQLLIACNHFSKAFGDYLTSGIDHAVMLDNNGNRVVAEDSRRDVLANAAFNAPDSFLWWIGEGRTVPTRISAQQQKAIDNDICFMADTLEALAKAMNAKTGVPPEKILASIKKYNEMVAKGEDTDFGKKPENMKVLEQPPFKASPVTPGVHHTMGGLHTNPVTTQVIDREGKPIGRLYAAGEVTGGVHGTNRLGGNALPDATVFGRLAGKVLSELENKA